MISWLKFADRKVSANGTNAFYMCAPLDWADYTVEDKADWCLDNYMPCIIDWIEGWVAAAQSRPSLDILFF